MRTIPFRTSTAAISAAVYLVASHSPSFSPNPFFNQPGATMTFFSRFIATTLSTLCCAHALAQVVTVSDPWARATVTGQKATGAFMTLTASHHSKLVAASTPVAGITEIHEMKMDKDVMRMAAVPSLALPAGKAVELKPGGYHVMLMDLKTPLTDKSTLTLTLTVEDAKGHKTTQDVQVPVRAMTPMSMHKH